MSGSRRPWIQLITARRLLTPDARTIALELTALERWLDDALAAEVDVIQIREKDLEAGPLTALAARLCVRASGCATRVLVNDRADVARAAGAHGVHLPADAAPVPRVRAIAPPGWIIGRSVHGWGEAAAVAGADYALFGTVFAGGSKPGDARTTGLAGLREAVAASRVPVIAIGGIDVDRAVECVRAGAAGIAAISLFLPEGHSPISLGPRRAVEALRAAFDST